MHPRHILMATLVAALWGGNFVAVKLATTQFPPIFLLFLRFSLVALLMLPLAPRIPRRCLGPVLAVSVTLAVFHFGLLFMGVQRIEASTAAIATQLGVPFSSLLAVALFGERLGWRRALGIAVAFAGVVVLAGAPQLADDWVGLGLVVIAAFAWGVANSILKRYGPFEPNMLSAWMALFAVPQLLLVSALTEQGQWQSLFAAGWVEWGAVLYTAVGASVIAYSLWYMLLNSNPVSQVVPFTLLAPVFAVIAAMLVLGEPLTLPLLLGGVLVVGGVALCELRLPRWRRGADWAAPPE